MKVVVESKQLVRLFRDGNFVVVDSDQDERKGLTSEEMIHENIHMQGFDGDFPTSEGFSGQSEAIPAGPEVPIEGHQTDWPGIQSGHLRSSSLRSGSQVHNNAYTKRGPQGSMPGQKQDFAVSFTK